MQNKINVSDNLISRRIQDLNYSLASFNQLLINEMLDNYSYECLWVNPVCIITNTSCV